MPLSLSHSAAMRSASRNDVHQLTVVPPPSVPPARIATPRSLLDVSPMSRYIVCRFISRWSIVGAVYAGPASSTTTRLPARA